MREGAGARVKRSGGGAVTLAVRAGGFSPGAGAGRVAMPWPPIRSTTRARSLPWRGCSTGRGSPRARGVLPAPGLARALVPLGRRLAEAEAAAEGSAERLAQPRGQEI